jgi:hypothetical protein
MLPFVALSRVARALLGHALMRLRPSSKRIETLMLALSLLLLASSAAAQTAPAPQRLAEPAQAELELPGPPCGEPPLERCDGFPWMATPILLSAVSLLVAGGAGVAVLMIAPGPSTTPTTGPDDPYSKEEAELADYHRAAVVADGALVVAGIGFVIQFAVVLPICAAVGCEGDAGGKQKVSVSSTPSGLKVRW